MIFKTGRVAVVRATSRADKVSEAHRIAPVESGKCYLELDGLDGDKFNSNSDMFPWFPEFCRNCHRYIYDMTYRGVKLAAMEDDICPDCGGKMDGGLLAENCRGILAWKSWIGRPLCLDHQSDDPALHYGTILDVIPYSETKTLRMAAAVDRARINRDRPGLLEAYESGWAKDVSQGSRVGYSLCSKCMHLAEREEDYCGHLLHQRGQLIPLEKGDRPHPWAIERDGFVRVGEVCCDVEGIEVSLVGKGACDNAKVRHVLGADRSALLESGEEDGMIRVSIRDLASLLRPYLGN